MAATDTGTRAATAVTAWGGNGGACGSSWLRACGPTGCGSDLTSLPEAFSMAWTICKTEYPVPVPRL